MHNFTLYSQIKKQIAHKLLRFPKKEQIRIKQAITLAEKYHRGQDRGRDDAEKTGYVIHCLRTCLWLMEQNISDSGIIIAAILHDTLEDTKLTKSKIKNKFGNRILKLVEGVTRPRNKNESERDKLKNKPKSYKKILRSTPEIRLIKTADLLDNMRSWRYIRKRDSLFKKFPRWKQEAKEFYIPIASSISKNAVKEMKKILKSLPK